MTSTPFEMTSSGLAMHSGTAGLSLNWNPDARQFRMEMVAPGVELRTFTSYSTPLEAIASGKEALAEMARLLDKAAGSIATK